MKKILRVLISLALGLCICSSLTAATITWTGASVAEPNNFQNPFNWDLLRIPQAEDDVIIPGGLGNYPTSLQDGTTIRSLLVQSGGFINISGGTVVVNATGCNCNAVSVEASASLEITNRLFIRNTSGDGIFNQGTISIAGQSTTVETLLIENIGGIGINNQSGGVITLLDDGGLTRIQNTGGTSIINNGTFTIEKVSWLFVDNGIQDPGNGFLNQGNLIISGGGNSDIQTNEGIVHNESSSLLSISVVNGGLLSSDPGEIFTIFPGVNSDNRPFFWFEKTSWSKFRAPLPGEKVILPEASKDILLANKTTVDDISSAPFVALQSISIGLNRTLDLRCATLDVENIDVTGTLLIGDEVTPVSGQLIIKNTLSNTGTIDNDGLITNLTGSGLGGTITGVGSQRTNIADVIWVGTVDSDWDNGDNWNTGTEPGATDEVFIPECTTCPIINSTGNTINSLVMEGDLTITNNGALEVDGSGLDCWANGIVIAQATLSNEGTLLIENSQQAGIHGFGCTIDNAGALTIQETIAEAISANHASILTNSSTGVLTMTNIGSDGIRMGDRGQFTNQNQIKGTNTGNNPNGPGDGDPNGIIFGRGLFILNNSKGNNSGSIEFNTTFQDAVFIHLFSEFIHSGTLNTTDSQQDGGIETSVFSFTHITETGIVNVLRSNNEGLEADTGSEVINDGTVTLNFAGRAFNGTTESIDIDEASTLTNNGTINITNAGEEFIEVDEGSLFINNGTFSGKTTNNNNDPAEGIEIDDNSTLINRGEISIDETTFEGFEIDDGSTLENYGTINLENVGVLNFVNTNPSPDEQRMGIEVNFNSTFLNCGALTITGNPKMRFGIWVNANGTVENTLAINITDANEYGIFVTDDVSEENGGQNSFTNSFDITVSGSGIEDIRNDNQFDNAECGLIKVEDGFNNGSSGVFNNEGQLVIAGDFTNTGTLNNNGVIADPDGGVAAASISGTILLSEADLPLREVECFRKPDEANGEPEEIPTMGEWTRLIFILFVFSLFIFGVFRLQGRDSLI